MVLAAAFHILLIISCSASVARAQELEPRAYSAAPTGVNFAIAGYANISGDVLFDPSLPVTDVEAKIHSATFGYLRTFGFFERAASLGIALPYFLGDFTGKLDGVPIDRSRTGWGDARFRFAVNLLGNPAHTLSEFTDAKPTATLGASLTVIAPTGQYEASRLLNIGSNRWAVKPEIGFSYPIDDWFFEVSAGAWLFQDNTNFFGGNRRSQDRLATYQIHGGYTFRPGLWLAADAIYDTGGQTSVNGADKQDLRENSRYGVTLSLPLSQSWSAKIAWSSGLATRVGSDFDIFALVFQYRWFDR